MIQAPIFMFRKESCHFGYCQLYGAPRGHPMDCLLYTSDIFADLELGGILFLLLAVAAYRGAGAAADLGNAQMEHSFPGFLGFPGGDDNTLSLIHI